VILRDFPAVFAEFRGKRFSLLWRGGRDGFGARDFHDRCDGHANTLTLIEDRNGNIFGGFTPVAWESRTQPPYPKADPSLKGFLFSLKNPHNLPVTKFALRDEMKDRAIVCDSSYGPRWPDLTVVDACNGCRARNATSLGNSYANPTGLDGESVFTGATNFIVAKIEVFMITD
jgi:hypothetical protein